MRQGTDHAHRTIRQKHYTVQTVIGFNGPFVEPFRKPDWRYVAIMYRQARIVAKKFEKRERE